MQTKESFGWLEQMNEEYYEVSGARSVVFVIYLIGFLIGLIVTMIILWTTWRHIEWTQFAIYGYWLLLGLCGVLLAYWVASDGEDIYDLQKKIHDLEQKYQQLDKARRSKAVNK